MAILLPALQRARAQGKDAVCKSNLHQLGLATTYYAQDMRDCLPYLSGTSGPNNQNAPYNQYQQILEFWPYLKDRRNFLDPSASAHNSVMWYKDPDWNSSEKPSFYLMNKNNSTFRDLKGRGAWPDIDFTDTSNFTTWPGSGGGAQWVIPLRTEYWFNDWNEGATTSEGEIPAISGGNLGKLPYPVYTSIITDGRMECWHTEKMRHGGANHIAFADAHVDKFAKLRYWDHTYTGPNGVPAKDYDSFKNRPFWAWGLTRKGIDGVGWGTPSPWW